MGIDVNNPNYQGPVPQSQGPDGTSSTPTTNAPPPAPQGLQAPNDSISSSGTQSLQQQEVQAQTPRLSINEYQKFVGTITDQFEKFIKQLEVLNAFASKRLSIMYGAMAVGIRGLVNQPPPIITPPGGGLPGLPGDPGGPGGPGGPGDPGGPLPPQPDPNLSYDKLLRKLAKGQEGLGALNEFLEKYGTGALALKAFTFVQDPATMMNLEYLNNTSRRTEEQSQNQLQDAALAGQTLNFDDPVLGGLFNSGLEGEIKDLAGGGENGQAAVQLKNALSLVLLSQQGLGSGKGALEILGTNAQAEFNSEANDAATALSMVQSLAQLLGPEGNEAIKTMVETAISQDENLNALPAEVKAALVEKLAEGVKSSVLKAALLEMDDGLKVKNLLKQLLAAFVGVEVEGGKKARKKGDEPSSTQQPQNEVVIDFITKRKVKPLLLQFIPGALTAVSSPHTGGTANANADSNANVNVNVSAQTQLVLTPASEKALDNLLQEAAGNSDGTPGGFIKELGNLFREADVPPDVAATSTGKVAVLFLRATASGQEALQGASKSDLEALQGSIGVLISKGVPLENVPDVANLLRNELEARGTTPEVAEKLADQVLTFLGTTGAQTAVKADRPEESLTVDADAHVGVTASEKKEQETSVQRTGQQQGAEGAQGEENTQSFAPVDDIRGLSREETAEEFYGEPEETSQVQTGAQPQAAARAAVSTQDTVESIAPREAGGSQVQVAEAIVTRVKQILIDIVGQAQAEKVANQFLEVVTGYPNVEAVRNNEQTNPHSLTNVARDNVEAAQKGHVEEQHFEQQEAKAVNDFRNFIKVHSNLSDFAEQLRSPAKALVMAWGLMNQGTFKMSGRSTALDIPG